ncbi:MAG: tetratricopeptide repeat protein [Kiritimatiellia bacterium]
MTRYSSRFLIACGIAALWLTAFSVSSFLWAVHGHSAPGRSGRSVIHAVMGAGRIALSYHFYELADVYFHRGVERYRPRAFADSWFQKAREEMSPRRHVHLGGKDIKEIMPWLEMAMASNPRNEDIYLVAAFWINENLNMPEKALEILRRGQREIPSSYNIQLEKARIHMGRGNVQAAAKALDAGLNIWRESADKDSFKVRNAKARLLEYRALVYEARGKYREAAETFEKVLDLFPERKHLLKRIDALKEGKEPSVQAKELWDKMLKADSRKHTACERHEHGHSR